MKFLICGLVSATLSVTGMGSAITYPYVTVNANASFGGVSNMYDSVTGLAQHGGGANQIWTFTSTPSTNILNLTSASVSTVFTGTDTQNDSVANDSSSASADLASGILRAAAGGYCSGTDGVTFAANACGQANALAEMQDGLTFTNTTGTTQDITVRWAFDGSAGTYYDTLNFLFCFGAGTLCAGNANSIPHNPNAPGYDFTFAYDCAQNSCDPGGTTMPTSGWVSTSVTGANTTTETFTGIYAVPAGMSTDTLNAYLYASCGAGDECDFSHTAILSITDPNGVSFTSTSGVLLTQAQTAPEPSTWGMLLIGGVLIISRRMARTLLS